MLGRVVELKWKELEFGKGLNIVAVMVGGDQTLHLEGTALINMNWDLIYLQLERFYKILWGWWPLMDSIVPPLAST